MKSEFFFVYILQSLKDFSFYIGQTDDLDARMSKHFDGMSKYTASKRPWRLKYFEVFKTRREAIIREKQLKAWKNTEHYRELISRRKFC
jgi:putative endonuclease